MSSSADRGFLMHTVTCYFMWIKELPSTDGSVQFKVLPKISIPTLNPWQSAVFLIRILELCAQRQDLFFGCYLFTCMLNKKKQAK